MGIIWRKGGCFHFFFFFFSPRTVFVPVSLARFSRLLVEWQDKRHTGGIVWKFIGIALFSSEKAQLLGCSWVNLLTL